MSQNPGTHDHNDPIDEAVAHDEPADREEALDDTLDSSFPASDPPSSIPDPAPDEKSKE